MKKTSSSGISSVIQRLLVPPPNSRRLIHSRFDAKGQKEIMQFRLVATGRRQSATMLSAAFCPSVGRAVCLSARLFVCLSACLPACLAAPPPSLRHHRRPWCSFFPVLYRQKRGSAIKAGEAEDEEEEEIRSLCLRVDTDETNRLNCGFLSFSLCRRDALEGLGDVWGRERSPGK